MWDLLLLCCLPLHLGQLVSLRMQPLPITSLVGTPTRCACCSCTCASRTRWACWCGALKAGYTLWWGYHYLVEAAMCAWNAADHSSPPFPICAVASKSWSSSVQHVRKEGATKHHTSSERRKVCLPTRHDILSSVFPHMGNLTCYFRLLYWYGFYRPKCMHLPNMVHQLYYRSAFSL